MVAQQEETFCAQYVLFSYSLSIWKLRNDVCFQGTIWKDERVLMGKVARMLRRWSCLGKGENVQYLEEIILRLEARCREPLRITWAEPLVQAAPPTSNWVTHHRASAESLSSSGATPSDSSVSPFVLAVTESIL